MTAEPPAISSPAASNAFRKVAADAEANCPISRLLKAEMTMNATLSN